MSAIMFHLLVQ